MSSDLWAEVTIETVELIKVIVNRGRGTNDSPIRNITQYYTKDGQLVAEHDDCVPVKWNVCTGRYERKEIK